jgi:H+-transporting ATPase
MAPIGLKWALAVWGYALVWFVINDRVKLGALRLLARHEGRTRPLS